MSRLFKILAALCFLVWAMSPNLALAQDKPGKDDILLRALFRDSPEDMIRSDGRGAYVSGRDCYVYFHPDGTLHFWVGPQSGRRVVFQFPKENRVRPVYNPENPDDIDIGQYCCFSEESVNPPKTQDLEPLKNMKMHTWNGTSFSPPQYDLLSLVPWNEAMPVRFVLQFDTKERDSFYLAYNKNVCPLCEIEHGWVWVKAIDLDGNLNTTERWEITP